MEWFQERIAIVRFTIVVNIADDTPNNRAQCTICWVSSVSNKLYVLLNAANFYSPTKKCENITRTRENRQVRPVRSKNRKCGYLANGKDSAVRFVLFLPIVGPIEM